MAGIIWQNLIQSSEEKNTINNRQAVGSHSLTLITTQHPATTGSYQILQILLVKRKDYTAT
eukprot:4537676-Ditylum_brightwellii.AAC.1